MILKKKKIGNGYIFKRIKYSGFSVCDDVCLGTNKCPSMMPYQLYDTCDTIYTNLEVNKISNYCYVYDKEKENNNK